MQNGCDIKRHTNIYKTFTFYPLAFIIHGVWLGGQTVGKSLTGLYMAIGVDMKHHGVTLI